MKNEQSAGGVVVNSKGQILLVHQNNDSWSLPKGRLEAGETQLQAALREIKEETGIADLELVSDLGEYQRHRIGKSGKGDDPSVLRTIHLFLFSTSQAQTAPDDPSISEARWVEKEKVCDVLTHPKDRDFFSKIMHQIQ